MSIKALTKAHVDAFKRLGRQDSPTAKVVLKLFDPRGASTWYLTELECDPTSDDYGIGFGYCILNGDLQCAELGSLSIFELLNVRRREPELTPENTPDLTKVRMGGPTSVWVIERDIHFPIAKMTVDKIIDKVQAGGHV